MERGPMAATDLVIPYQLESAGLRGRFLRFGPLLSAVLARHRYPRPVAGLLAETMALTGLLGSAVKFEGVFTLQANGAGPVRICVADMTDRGEMRGYAQFDEAALAGLPAAGLSSSALLGHGHLALTAERGAGRDRYQGIVALEGTSLTECVHHYFRQSEQIDAAIKVAVANGGGEGDAAWRAGAIMIQRVPGEGRRETLAAEEDEEDWREAVTLMASVGDDELTDPRLAPDRLLYRLFHEPGVRMFRPRGLTAGCRCSRERVAGTLAALPRAEVLALMEDGAVRVTCEFCGAAYAFDEAALEALYA